MGKPTICIGENKDADQLRGNREADQRLCFRYSDSTISLLLKSKILSFWLFSVLVQVGLCRTCSETTLLVFPRGGPNAFVMEVMGATIGSFFLKCLRKRNNLDSLCNFHSINVQYLHCLHLSISQ